MFFFFKVGNMRSSPRCTLVLFLSVGTNFLLFLYLTTYDCRICHGTLKTFENDDYLTCRDDHVIYEEKTLDSALEIPRNLEAENDPVITSEYLLSWMIHNRPRRNFSDSDNKTGYPQAIVPNIVHFVRLQQPVFKFYQMLIIKSVYVNHRPKKIYIHCNPCNFNGKYWDMVKNISILERRPIPIPTHVFGKKIGNIWHASDVARLLVMMTFGGIYLDNDCYVVGSLDKYRHFEFAIGWSENEFLGNQVQIAHRDARFLKLYYETYRNYVAEKWYYNGGELPTTSVLYHKPHLVHRVKTAFGVTNLIGMLYQDNTDRWRTFDVIHLLMQHRDKKEIAEFDEDNVKSYNRTFGQMARDLLE